MEITTENNSSRTSEQVKPGYKKTAVGNIPEDWKTKKMKEVGTFHRGKGIPKKDLIETGLNAIRYGEIYTVHHYFIKEFYSFIDDETANSSFPLSKGDILFTGSGETLEDIGKSVAFISDVQAYAGGDITILRPKKNNYDSKFLGFLTNNDVFRRQTYRAGQGQSVVHIYPSNLKKIQLPIPPLPEQKAIADCLTTWDKGIEKLTQLIASKKEQKKGLMQQLLTGKKRLDGFEEEWGKLKLKEILKESKIVSNENDKTKRLSVRLHLEGVHQRPVRGTEADTTTFYKRKSGQFIYGKQNFHNGSLGIIPQEFNDFETTSDIPSFDISKKVNHKWFFYYVSRFDFYTKMESKTTGTGSKRLHPREFLNTSIPKLPVGEQESIAIILTTADKEIELLEKKLETFKTQKKGLMQVLLTGTLRLCSGTNG